MPDRPPIHVGVVADRDPAIAAHRGIEAALPHSALSLGRDVRVRWLGTDAVADAGTRILEPMDALWCAPGSPYRSFDGALAAIRFARERGRPFLGTCGGFQHALIEFARNVVGLPEADHAESNPDAACPVVSRLSCSLIEQTGRIALVPGSRLAAIYGSTGAVERYHCDFGLNPGYRRAIHDGGLRVSGVDESDEVRAVERRGDAFFVATLFQPERRPVSEPPHPLIVALLRAAASRD